MLDLDTFLTRVSVAVDDFCQTQLPPEPPQPGPVPSLYRSEVITLALFGQWAPFPSERAFYRSASQQLRPACPPAASSTPPPSRSATPNGGVGAGSPARLVLRLPPAGRGHPDRGHHRVRLRPGQCR